MSTSYNDQWVLERPRPEHHEHAGSHGEQPRTLRERGERAHKMARPHFPRRARKRPRWIDRDT